MSSPSLEATDKLEKDTTGPLEPSAIIEFDVSNFPITQGVGRAREVPPEKHREWSIDYSRDSATQYSDLQEAVGRCGRALSQEHPLYRTIHQALTTVCDCHQLNPDSFELVVAVDPIANATIVRNPSLTKSLIVVNTGLLHDIKDFYGHLSLGHIIFCLGHEIGHYLKGHYDSFFTARQRIGTDGTLAIHDHTITRSLENLGTRISQRAFSRNQELEVDKIGFDSLLHARITLTEGAEVLQYLTSSAQPESSPRNATLDSELMPSAVEAVAQAMTRSHPASLERENAGRAYVRERNTAVDLSSGKPWSELTGPSEDVTALLDAQTKSTDLQEAMRLISQSSPVFVPKTIAILEQYANSPYFGDIAAHAWLYVVTALRVERNLCPLLPFGWLQELGADNRTSSAYDRINPSTANSLKQLEDFLCDQIDGFARRNGLNPSHEVFFRVRGMFSSREARSMWAIQIVSPASKNTSQFFSQISELGRIRFDFSTTSLDFLQRLNDSSDDRIRKRGQALGAMFRSGEFDIRWPCIREALQEQLLDNISEPAQIVSALVSIEQIAGNTTEWFQHDYERSLGEQVALWAQEKHEAGQLDIDAIAALFGAIANRETIAADPTGEVARFDAIALEAISGVTHTIFPKAPEDAVGFIVKALPTPSNTRDLALMDLASRYANRSADLLILPYLSLADARPIFLRHTQGAMDVTTLSRNKRRKLKKLGLLDDGKSDAPIIGARGASSLTVLDKMLGYSIDLPRTRFGNYVEHFIATRKFRGDSLKIALCSGLATPLLASPSFRSSSLPHLLAHERVEVAQYLRSERGRLSHHVETISAWLSGEDGTRISGMYVKKPSEYFAQLPPSEVKDFLLLKALHGTITNTTSQLRLEMLFPPETIKRLLPNTSNGSHATSPRADKLVRFALKQLSFVGEGRSNPFTLGEAGEGILHKALLVAKIFGDDLLFFKLSNGTLDLRDVEQTKIILPTVRSIGADYGAYAFSQRYPKGVVELSAQPEAAITTLIDYFPFPSSQRDHRLLQIFDRALDSDPLFAASPEALKVFDLIEQHLLKATVGRRIYAAALLTDPSIEKSFDRHLELLMRTHPAGSITREDAIREFCNGTGTRPPAVTTWEHYRQLIETEQQATSRDEHSRKLIESSTLALLRNLISDPVYQIDEEEKVNTLLWALGERDKSKLVRCIELVEDRSFDRLTSGKLNLSYSEKKLILTSVLSGPGGVLRGSEASKRRFLDHLFSSFLAQKEACSDDERRAIKAAFDTLMHYLDPDRAAEHLTTLILSHIERSTFEELVRVGFGSIPVWGPRSGQYLVTQTSTLSKHPELSKKLLSLASRVPNSFSKTQLFELLTRQFGDLAEQLVPQIHQVCGDGATATVFKVSIPCEHGTRDVALAVLRPDTLRDLPVDGQAMYALVKTVEAAPEIFNGVALNERMFTSVQQGLALDVDRPRCVRIQRNFAHQLIDFNQKYPGIPVSAPQVIDSLSIETASGVREIPVSVGPFLFMELAEGETLDRILADDSVAAEERGELLRTIGTRLSALLLHQLGQSDTESGTPAVLHCDLHPGNIRVIRPTDPNEPISLCLLDLPVSIEVSKELSYLCTQLISLAVRADTESTSGLERLMRLWMGFGTIDPHDAEQYLARALTLLTLRNSTAASSYNVDEIARGACTLLRDSTKPLQQRFGTVLTYIQNSGLPIPTELSTLLRGIAVSQYLFEATEWAALAPLIDRALAQRDEATSQQPIDIRGVTAKFVLLSDRLSMRITAQKAKKWAQTIDAALDPVARVATLVELLGAQSQASGIPASGARQAEILRVIRDDSEIVPMMIGERTAHSILEILRRVQEQQDSSWLADYMRTVPIDLEQARQTAVAGTFGFSPLCWHRKLMAGTWVTGIDKKTNEKKHFLVALHTEQEPRFIEIEAPSEQLEAILMRLWNRRAKLTQAELEEVEIILGRANKSSYLDLAQLKRRLKDITVRDNEAGTPRWIGMSAVVHDFGQTERQYIEDIERTRLRLTEQRPESTTSPSPTTGE